MKRLISILVSLMIISNLLYAGSLSSEEKHIVSNENIIEIFQKESLPKKFIVAPFQEESKWTREIKTKEEYIAWAMIFSVSLASSTEYFSEEDLLPKLQQTMNSNEDTAKELLKNGLSDLNSVTYDVAWNPEKEDEGAILLRFQYSSMFETAIPFRIIENKKVKFLYDSISIKIPEVSRIWLFPLYKISE